MFKLLLIGKYLRRKLAPLFAALAVMLCTAMVIIVISVMGGFLDTLRHTVRQLTPQVTIRSGSLYGFPHYEKLIERLEARPEIATADAVINSFGLIQLEGRSIPVQIQGVRPEKLDRIVRYRQALQWSEEDLIRSLEEDARAIAERRSLDALDQQIIDDQRQRLAALDLVRASMTFVPPRSWRDRTDDPERMGVVIGITVNPMQLYGRDEKGRYNVRNAALGEELILTTMPPISRRGAVVEQPRSRALTVVNEFKSGHSEFDSNLVFVAFDQLQEMLRMAPEEQIDPETGEPLGTSTPGRASDVILQGAPGYTLAQIQAAAEEEQLKLTREYPEMPMLYTLSWEQMHATILGAVQNEKGLVTFLFVIISVVAIVMVATTFYMIVLEKTRDIGVLRAIGASQLGIAQLFLGYGLAIGIAGALLGFALAWGIVTNLNEIQALLRQTIGWQMWDPQIYAFDRIPGRIDLREAGPIVLGAILSSVIGATIPATIAARLKPVEALRHE